MRTRIPNSRPDCRLGITLIETVMALTLMTFAAGALLTALSSTVQVSNTSLQTAIANGLADQLMDEIASVSFPSGSGSGSTSGGGSGSTSDSGSGSTSGVGRTGYNDLDSYNGYSVSPPQARSGSVIGLEGTTSSGSPMVRPVSFQPNPKLLSHYRQQVLVEKITDSGTTWITASQSTTLRRVTVTISYTDAQGKTTSLATQVRVFSNVAVAP